jgi:hypothetical protein
MAVKLKAETFYTKKPEQSQLKELAKETNSIPLSNIPDSPQILLPPPEHALIRNNFQIYSEEILQNFSTENKNESAEQKLEEEFGIGTKRHSMIGLKRRDYDNRPNVVLSKKKMRLSASHIEGKADFTHKGNYEESQGHSFKASQAKPSTSAFHQSSHKHNEDIDENIFDHEEEDEMMQRQDNFLQGDGSDMDEYNYDNFS